MLDFQIEDEQNNYSFFTYIQGVGFNGKAAANMILKCSSNHFGYHGFT